MEKFVKFSSVAIPIPEDDIDTDIIFPARFLLLLDKSGLGKHLFHERRHSLDGSLTNFVLNTPPFDKAKILVANANFGSGSSREQAVWALADFGIRCVIAPSFGEIFYSNCFKSGVLPIVLPDKLHQKIMAAAFAKQQITIDLEQQKIYMPDDLIISFDIDAYRRRALLLGLDEIEGILVNDTDEIAEFEINQRRKYPWILLDDGRLDSLYADKEIS